MSIMWEYYVQILRTLRVGIFSRPIKVRPVDRISSDNWPVISIWTEIWGELIVIAYSSIFVFAFCFTFPSETERILWRVASIYTAIYGLVGSLWAGISQHALMPLYGEGLAYKQAGEEDQHSNKSNWLIAKVSRLGTWLRNNSPSGDPALVVPLRALIPATVFCALYSISRAYVLVEDVVGLRKLPSSAFDTVDWSLYIPHV